jgi:hypothetical protein
MTRWFIVRPGLLKKGRISWSMGIPSRKEIYDSVIKRPQIDKPTHKQAVDKALWYYLLAKSVTRLD